jgi:hypothetical protein
VLALAEGGLRVVGLHRAGLGMDLEEPPGIIGLPPNEGMFQSVNVLW